MCERGLAGEPGYAKYPRLPVLRCAGFEPRATAAMTQPRQLLVMAGHAQLDGVVVGARVDDAPHGVGDLLGGLGRRPAAHLVDQRELEPLDLLLGRALPE